MIDLTRDESEPTMKANAPTLLPPRKRPDSARRRPARSFAPTSLGLESRTMPTTIGIAMVGSIVFLPPPPPPISPSPSEMTDGDGLATTDSHSWHGPNNPSATGQGPAIGPGGRTRNHVGMTEADIRIDGRLTPEFSFADPNRNLVALKLGYSGAPVVLSAAQGIDNPGSVVLADVNGDGVPDLIVANSGGDNIEIFPGLPGGGIGPAINGTQGFAVGNYPAGITVGDINGDGVADLVVANRDSNNVSILYGQGGGASWTLASGGTLAAGNAPVKTALQDTNGDGNIDLYICNSGSNNVTLYHGVGSGVFDTENPTSIEVGIDPTEMFIGRFDRRSQLDLVTVNSGSDNLTFLAGISSNHPETLTFTSGGSQPDAAFAVDLNHDGVLDLVVANSGDGRLALLQGGNEGFQIAGVISRADVPSPTAVAPALVTENGIDFFAASAGENAAQLLHFNLGSASDFLSIPLETSAGLVSSSEFDLIAQLLPFNDAALEMIAVLWDGGPSSRSTTLGFEEREASLSTVPDTETESQRIDQDKVITTPGPSPLMTPPTFPPDNPASWSRFVLGLDLALGQAREPVEAISARDRPEIGDDRAAPDLTRSRPAPVDPDLESAARAVDEALRSLRSETSTEVPEVGPDGRPDRLPGEIREGNPATSTSTQTEEVGSKIPSVPILTSAILLATHLILQATTTHPFTIRRKAGQRLVARAIHPIARHEPPARL